MLPDCLGLTLSETRELLQTNEIQIKEYVFTGPYRPVAGREGEGRVVRLRLVGANQVELVLAFADITVHQLKGGVRTNGP